MYNNNKKQVSIVNSLEDLVYNGGNLLDIFIHTYIIK